MTFNTVSMMNKFKGLWYTRENDFRKRKMKPYKFRGRNLELYEATLPPLLRYFHEYEINPSGWIEISDDAEERDEESTTQDYEYDVEPDEIKPLLKKETAVPYKQMCWDIEASSSHGDFPLAKKGWDKFIKEVIDYWKRNETSKESFANKKDLLIELFREAIFDLGNRMNKIYLKEEYDDEKFNQFMKRLEIKWQSLIGMIDREDIDGLCSDGTEKDEWGKPKKKGITTQTDFPKVEGDVITFIGSTFQKYGEDKQYLNHMVSLGKCEDIPEVECREIISCKTEKELLMRWAEVIKTENPEMMIGYNIMGFDWKFIIERTDELGIKEQFLKELSKNENQNWKRMVKHKEIKIASGTHKSTYVEMEGRVQLDLYSHFRKEENLPSYKLDHVSSYFIGDGVKKCEAIDDNKTKIISKNLMGIKDGDYISFEILGNSTDMYMNGKKFVVKNVNHKDGTFVIDHELDMSGNKLRWCLNKDDITLEEMFNADTPEKRAKVAKYCFQDCNLLHNLMKKCDILTGFIEFSAICKIPLSFTIQRGQGIKLLSFIAYKCSKAKILMPDLEKVQGGDGYEGAICLPPKRGFYSDNPIAVNDYSSLYPSCMVSENISHDSKVWTKEYDLNNKLLKDTGEKDDEGNYIYDNLKGYKYVDVKFDTYKYIRKTLKGAQVKELSGYKICRYIQFNNDKKGIMPSVLTELLAARKATKKLKKEAKDPFMKSVYDKRQLGIKVVANSLYGQCGAKTSSFYDIDIAASTTATGRKLLMYAKRIIEDCYSGITVDTKYGKMKPRAEAIYGDSVTPDTPLLLKNKKTGLIEFKQIDNLSNDEWKSYDGFKAMESNRREKQQNMVENYQIFTSKGWSNIKRVIRHKTRKNIYRVTTHTGMVDVTEDHSLLDETGKIVKPTEVKIGMKLLHNYPQFEKKEIKLKDILNYIQNIGKMSLCEKKAFILGFFYGDGSCGKYDSKWGNKYSWALNQKDIEMSVILQSLLIEIYNEPFKINDTIKSSGVYKIVPGCGNVKKYVEMYRPICYNKDKYKIIPIDILNGKYDIRYAYFAGYYAADGSKCPGEKAETIRMSNKGKIGSAMLYYLASSIGFNVSINTRKDKLNITRLTCTSGKQRKTKNVIKKIDLIGENVDDFVYDIETETGNFNTGYSLIVKNTDSVFFTFNLKWAESGERVVGKQALDVTIELAKEAGELATKYLKVPHDLEYEKTFMPFLLLAKKKYVGMLYENDINYCKRKSMGIVLKRRDNAPCVKDSYGGVVDILMNKCDANEAVNFIKSYLDDMINERIPMNKLIITKKLNAYYKNPKQIAHKVLADRMGERDPGNKPSVGSRLPFIYIKTKKKMKLQGDRIEHPDYIKKTKLKPDYEHYITNQIMKPLLQLFGLLLEQLKIFKRHKRMYRIKINGIKREWSHDEKKCHDKIAKESDKRIKKLIFDEYINVYRNKVVGQNSINKFFMKVK
jgi:DNA polymerase elongation subunit (family B)